MVLESLLSAFLTFLSIALPVQYKMVSLAQLLKNDSFGWEM